MLKVRTKRRIVLTGTPLQNKLAEYHTLVKFVYPGLLSTVREFKKRFQKPIESGQHADAEPAAVSLMKRRTHVLVGDGPSAALLWFLLMMTRTAILQGDNIAIPLADDIAPLQDGQSLLRFACLSPAQNIMPRALMSPVPRALMSHVGVVVRACMSSRVSHNMCGTTCVSQHVWHNMCVTTCAAC
jgi:hypothetical protein